MDEYRVVRCKNPNGPSITTLRKRQYELSSGRCQKCDEDIPIEMATLDHKVPVVLGGSRFDPSNLWILCRKCDSQKTKVDHRVIHAIKQLGLIQTCGFICFAHLPMPQVESLYHQLFALAFKAETRRED